MRRDELFSACKRLGIVEANIILVNATNLPDDPNVDWRPDAVARFILHTVESLDIQAIFTFDRDGVSSHPNHCAVYYAAASLCLANLLPKGESRGLAAATATTETTTNRTIVAAIVVVVWLSHTISNYKYNNLLYFCIFFLGCKFYTLDSINLARKYLSVFDLLCTCLMSSHWYYWGYLTSYMNVINIDIFFSHLRCVLSWKEAAVVRSAMLEHQSQMKWFRWLYIYTSRYMFINSIREINRSDVELEMQIHDN